jgi:hypothetical protein
MFLLWLLTLSNRRLCSLKHALNGFDNDRFAAFSSVGIAVSLLVSVKLNHNSFLITKMSNRIVSSFSHFSYWGSFLSFKQ